MLRWIIKKWKTFSLCDYGSGRQAEIDFAVHTIEGIVEDAMFGWDDPCWDGEHDEKQKSIEQAMELIKEELS